MPRNGSGGYTLPTNSWNPATNGVSATPADWQALINDLASSVSASVAVDGQTALTGNLNAGNNKLTNIVNGTNPQDAVAVGQLQAATAGKANSGVNTDITALNGVSGSGVSLGNGSTVITQPANDNSDKGASTFFVNRAVNGGVALGSKIQPISTGIASNALTISLSPTVLDFRSQTLNDGTVTTVKSASNQLINLPTGASLGFTSGVSGRMAVLAFNNGGSILMAVANVLGQSLDESDLKATTGISGTSTAIDTIYTNAGPLGSNAYRVVGYIDATWVSGTGWTLVSKTQGAGGLAVASNVIIKSINQGTVAPTTSGTSFDFTGIPTGVKRITVMFNGVSLNGVSNFLIQIGAGSIETTGYAGGVIRAVDTAAINGFSSPANGFQLTGNSAAANLFYGTARLNYLGGNVWVMDSTLGSPSSLLCAAGGSKTISGTLDRIRLTTVNGTDTFDAGSINIMWE